MFILYVVGVFLHLNTLSYNIIEMFCHCEVYTFVNTLGLLLRVETFFYSITRNRVIKRYTEIVIV